MSMCTFEEVRADLLAIYSSVHRPDMRQSKTILTIDKRGSIARNNVFDLNCRQADD